MPMPGTEPFVCPYAEDHPVIEQRMKTLEREVGEIRRRHDIDAKDWSDFLIAFGELKAKVEGLSGRVAGYVVAGSMLAAGLAFLGQFIIRR
jgi:hypothetical protein